MQQKAAEAQRNKAPTRPEAVRPVNSSPAPGSRLATTGLACTTPDLSLSLSPQPQPAPHDIGDGSTSAKPNAIDGASCEGGGVKVKQSMGFAAGRTRGGSYFLLLLAWVWVWVCLAVYCVHVLGSCARAGLRLSRRVDDWPSVSTDGVVEARLAGEGGRG